MVVFNTEHITLYKLSQVKVMILNDTYTVFNVSFMIFCPKYLVENCANKSPDDSTDQPEPDDEELSLAMRVARGSAFALW